MTDGMEQQNPRHHPKKIKTFKEKENNIYFGILEGDTIKKVGDERKKLERVFQKN